MTNDHGQRTLVLFRTVFLLGTANAAGPRVENGIGKRLPVVSPF